MKLKPSNNYQYVPGHMAPYIIGFILEMRLTSVGKKNVNGQVAYHCVRHALLCKAPYTRSTKLLKVTFQRKWNFNNPTWKIM